MVVAYLRGLLPATRNYGIRSIFTEDIILESIAAEHIADDMQRNVRNDLALTPALTEKGVRELITRSSVRSDRASELRLLNIYKIEEQIGNYVKVENASSEISLSRLYEFAEKQGILQALADYDDGKEKKSVI